ncbi:MAG: MotA/TolQ/Exb proton channel, partial [Deltaproteobacteria bacterium]
MKNFLMIWVAFLCMGAVCVMAQDMRTSHLSQEKKRQMMQKKADDELLQAKAEAKEKILEIKNDKKKLKAAIADLTFRNENLKLGNIGLEKSILKLKETQVKLKADLSESQVVNQELAGFIKINAKELQSLLVQSPQSALIRDRHQFLDPILGSGENPEKFPSMDDITQMADTLFGEIKASGEVKITMTDIIDRQGREQKARVLTLGNFTGIYMLKKASGSKDEIGFLLYSDQSQRFFALSRLPSSGMAAKMAAYFKGESPDVPMDISKGGALRQLTHQLN